MSGDAKGEEMIIAKIKLTGTSPFSMSRYHHIDKDKKESEGDFEKRIWREKSHYNEDGMIFIPAMMIKNCLSEAAKYLSERIEGKGQSTWTKHFEAGIMVEDDIVLKIHKDKVEGEWVFVPSNGQRGGGKRVDKCFPRVPKGWNGETSVIILDETITKEVFEKHLKDAGRFIGLGRFRPRNNGTYGRFDSKIISWKKED